MGPKKQHELQILRNTTVVLTAIGLQIAGPGLGVVAATVSIAYS